MLEWWLMRIHKQGDISCVLFFVAIWEDLHIAYHSTSSSPGAWKQTDFNGSPVLRFLHFEANCWMVHFSPAFMTTEEVMHSAKSPDMMALPGSRTG